MRTKEISKITAIILSIIIAVMTFGITPSVFAEGDAVAKIGDTEYATVNDAFANSNDGDTITLIADANVAQRINVTTKVDLDLNGKTLTLKGSGARKIWNYGELTIKGNGIMTNELGSYGMIDNFGKLTIENGTFIDAGGGDGSSFRTNAGATDAEITVNGGTFRGVVEQTGNAFLYCNVNGQITVNSGTFESESNRAYAFINNGGVFTVNNATVSCRHGGFGTNSGETVINNGSFTATNYYGCWITNNGYTQATINGGQFTGLYGLYTSVDDGNQDVGDVAIQINGGEFTGRTKAAVAMGSKNTEHEWALEIRGGTYSSDVSKYVDTESGYMQYPTEDNRYKVMKEARLSIEPLVQYYRVGESAAINYEILNSNEFFNKDSLIFEKGDANDIKEAEYYDFSMYYDTINNNAITLKGDVVTAVEPGVALVNIGTEGLGGDYVVIVVYDVAPENNQSEADKQASEMLLDAFKNNENTIGLTEEEAFEISYAIIAGKEITTEVVAEPLKEAEKEDAKLVEEKVESGQKLAGYYDISVLVKVNGEEIARLRELGKKIKVELEVPKDLPKVSSGYTRTYSVIRVHDGKAEVIAKDLVAEDGKIPVETDKFSTYAVTYTDIVSTNPKTGDTIMIAVAIFTVSVIAITILKKKRK